jgi:hypothetical protein
VIWENMEMVHSSIFSSKNDKNPRQRYVVPFKMRHVATLFFLVVVNATREDLSFPFIVTH